MEGDNIPPADDEIIAAYDGDDQVLQAAAALADFVVPQVSDEDGLDGEDPECFISHCRPQLEGSTEWCQNMSVHLRYGTNSVGVCQRLEHVHTGEIISLDIGYKWKLKFAPNGFGFVQSDLTKVWLRHLFKSSVHTDAETGMDFVMTMSPLQGGGTHTHSCIGWLSGHKRMFLIGSLGQHVRQFQQCQCARWTGKWAAQTSHTIGCSGLCLSGGSLHAAGTKPAET